MAQLFPDLKNIHALNQPPTPGELALLDFLTKTLNNDYEIFFQPYINGDQPDIVILKKNSGVIIIEVKDWHLEHYYLSEDASWHLKKNGAKLLSPLSQVKKYKDNLYTLHIEGLLAKSLINKYYQKVVNTVVYFHFENENVINSFLTEDFQEVKFKKYQSFLRYIHCWGKDSLTENKLNNFLSLLSFNHNSQLFSDELYNNFHRYLKPPFHMKEEGKNIVYTKEQQELIISAQRPRRKIKGIAGCGKTLVLAKRAVNAYLRTKSTVLILTYNLSLKNYIHDRISDVREEFPWEKFYITNYHQFFITEANNYGFEIHSLSAFDDVGFFENQKNDIQKYKVLLIDEIQDYKTEWLEILTTYFLEPEGEFVVFGDEKQNIYKRQLDEKSEPRTVGIRGDWNKSLSTSKRFADEIGRLALAYQKELLAKKYNVEELQIVSNPIFNFEQKILKHIKFDIESTYRDLFLRYVELISEFKIHPSDISFLSSKVEGLREVDFLIRNELKEKTITTFETKEFLNKLKSESTSKTSFDKKIEEIRRYKKNHFWMKSGITKLSSIHSFKGWESHTIFLLIEQDENNQFETTELIYTALTRAKLNLFVFNIANSFYSDFFSQHMDSN